MSINNQENILINEIAKKDVKSFWRYIFITLVITWIFWLPGVLCTYTSLNLSSDLILIFVILGAFTPSITGIIFTYKEQGKAGVKNLFNRLKKGKLGYWWLVIIFLIPLLIFIAHGINYIITGATILSSDMLENPWKIPFGFIMTLFMLGPLGEEFGWRGYALPKLGKNALNSIHTYLFGLVWALWHLPVFFCEGAPHTEGNLPFIPFAITIFGVSIIITWLTEKSEYSMITPIFLHAMVNFIPELTPLLDKTTGNYNAWNYVNILSIIFCVFLVLYYTVLKKKNDIIPN